MYRDVYSPIEECLFDFFGEEAFAFQFVEPQILNAISLCFNNFERTGVSEFFELPLEKSGLPERQTTAAGSDSYRIFQIFAAKLGDSTKVDARKASKSTIDSEKADFPILAPMQLSAREIASLINGEVEGNPDVLVNRPSKIEEGGTGSISFLGDLKYEPFAYSTDASVLIVDQSFRPKEPLQPTLIRVPEVRAAFTTLLTMYDEQKNRDGQVGVDPLASVHPSATLAEEVSVGAFTVIGEQTRVGEGCRIDAQVYIGKNVILGKRVRIFPGARILSDCIIGDHCVIHSNVVVGSDGFGFVPDAQNHYRKVPQVGNVLLEANVEIGANSTIDRATVGSTVIRQGVKLDNLVQVGHNVEIGRNTVIAAQTGIAGSTKIGANCRIGGQVGFVGHIQIADGTQIQAKSGIGSTVSQPNQALFGYPAIPYTNFVRSYVVFKKLPGLYRTIQRLERAIQEIQAKS